MALTPTDFADQTAVGLFVGEIANTTAMKATPFLTSGVVVDARVAGAFATEAGVVSFPKFNADNVVSATLPADGSAVANSFPATLTYANETVIDKIVPYQYMPNAVNRSIEGQAGHLSRLAQHIGKLMGKDLQASLIAKLEAAATAATQAITSGNAAIIDVAAFLKAIAVTYGENWNPADFFIVVHPKVYGDLIASTVFMDAHKSSVKDMSGLPMPSLYGMGLLMCSDVNKTGSIYKTSVVRRGTPMVYPNGTKVWPEVHIPASGVMHIDTTYSFATYVNPAYQVGAMTYATL